MDLLFSTDQFEMNYPEVSAMTAEEAGKIRYGAWELTQKKQRNWLVSRGKAHVLDFQDHEIANLRKCFNSLDEDGSGSIGVQELENPLIGLGFAENKTEIEEMVAEIDADGSGQIEFDEFLLILKNSGTTGNSAKLK